MVDVSIQKLHDDMTTPHYAHEGDAGIDLRSAINYILKAGESYTVPTGTKMAIPNGHVGLIWDKSGHAAKNVIHVLAGVVDSGYRGEIKIVLKNLGTNEFEIKKDMKIAQILIQPVARANLIEKESLEDTTRGEGGFGSTGNN